MPDVTYYLRDLQPPLVAAWERRFAGVEQVRPGLGDIFGTPADAIISPANSFGYMDGGIDLAYTARFGWQLQERLQQAIADEHDGELPVGQAVVLETGDAALPYLISAPTMRVPEDVRGTLNAYLAFRAALIAIRDFNARRPGAIKTVLCPGLGTATGLMPPDTCARQMHAAYMRIAGGSGPPAGISGILAEHQLLRGTSPGRT